MMVIRLYYLPCYFSAIFILSWKQLYLGVLQCVILSNITHMLNLHCLFVMY